MRPAAWLIGFATVIGCAAYVFIYLYRWEWHRALIMGIFLVAAEVPVATALVLRRLRGLATELEASGSRPEADPGVVARIREAAPRRDHFAWLDPRAGRTNVFITLFVGGGILISGLAWLIDRLASGTGGRHMEGDLARRLSVITFPTEGLVISETELLAEEAPFRDDPELRLLLGPGSRP